MDLRQVARVAEGIVKQAVAEAGLHIEPAAARLVAERAGTDIGTLRGDVERLLLYAAGKKTIDVKDVHEVVSAETSQDDWAVTNAIQRGDRAEALRQLALALEAGGVSYQILGPLGGFVREKLPAFDARRVPAAIDALFRTDLELKSSGGDPRVLLERLVAWLSAQHAFVRRFRLLMHHEARWQSARTPQATVLEIALAELKKNPPATPKRPPFPVRTRQTVRTSP